MEQLRESPSNFEQALRLHSLGYRLVALRQGTKIPRHKGFQQISYTEVGLRREFDGTGSQVGILTGSDLVVLDIDSTSAADLQWVTEHVGDTPMKVRSPSGGVHFYFRTRRGVEYGNGVKLRGKPYDLRWQGTFIVCPWSRSEQGVPYSWLGDVLPASELPLLKVSPLRERRRRRPLTAIEPSGSADVMVRRAWAWAACVEGAVSGQRGHDRTFRFVCRMLHPPPRGFGLALAEAWPILLAYNARCVPPWSDGELKHKCEDALKKF